MDFVGGLVAFVIMWVVVLFVVLPFGVRQPEAAEEGHMPGAPDNPRIGLKFAITTGITAILWAILYIVVVNGWIALPLP
jgi:predicted secreted protein